MPDPDVDIAAALDWAASALGAGVTSYDALDGGVTSTMLALQHDDGAESVPYSIALDADGTAAGAAAHLMSRLPGAPLEEGEALGEQRLQAMVDLLTTIHEQRPAEPFRTFQSWAWEAKWVVPAWTRHPESWRRAFEVLAGPAPAYEPTFLHRDFSHRNLLWPGEAITGVVDWVETSTGPAWLDAAHAASNLALAYGTGPALDLLRRYAAATGTTADAHWLVMDAVGYLPPPGKRPLFGRSDQLERLDSWLEVVVRDPDLS
ncbi:aminoglycoside phosphotransferase family protein [uncultured Nocardioides sp.]|uniref:aminoglycoside phosphotransferase family protein n=1 Tax=uncultured Nocardioides sp. TaxID=198441 RepID=UPI002628D37E|nr:aminoglycoside phosphotransferase family protein [uncultured Nocardioides sp.]